MRGLNRGIVEVGYSYDIPNNNTYALRLRAQSMKLHIINGVQFKLRHSLGFSTGFLGGVLLLLEESGKNIIDFQQPGKPRYNLHLLFVELLMKFLIYLCLSTYWFQKLFTKLHVAHKNLLLNAEDIYLNKESLISDIKMNLFKSFLVPVYFGISWLIKPGFVLKFDSIYLKYTGCFENDVPIKDFNCNYFNVIPEMLQIFSLITGLIMLTSIVNTLTRTFFLSYLAVIPLILMVLNLIIIISGVFQYFSVLLGILTLIILVFLAVPFFIPFNLRNKV